MSLIEKLTEEQEKELAAYYQDRLEVGRSIVPINHANAERIITKFYERIAKPAPKFSYFPSPMACAVAVENESLETPLQFDDINEAKVDAKIINMLCSNRFCGQQWIAWNAFYTFAEKIGVKYSPEDSELLKEWKEESEQLHWWHPFEDVVFIIERPIHLTVNEAGNLHNETCMAIEYADGWGIYSLNGIIVPKYLVVTPSEELDIKFFTNEKNADVKAEFVRKYGIERMISIGNKVDSYINYDQEENPWWWKSEYELWDMGSVFELEYQPYVKMKNQTTGIWHVEAVSPACRTLVAAIKERFGGKEMRIVDIS